MSAYKVSFKSLLYILVGNLGLAAALDCFFTPNEIAAGGFGGIGVIVNSLLPVSVGTVVFLISVPVFIWSWFVQGPAYTVSALLSTAAFSIFADLLSFLPCLTENKLLASVCGGALYGVSGAVLVRGYVAGSGTDLLARLLVTRSRHISLGACIFMCDAAVVLASVFVFGDIESGIYAGAAIAVCSFTTDKLIHGFNKAVVFEVIPPDGESAERLAEAVMRKLDRGVTLIPAVGMYQRSDRHMLMIAVSPKQIYEVKDMIHALAPGSFAVMLHASEVIGEGFKGLDVTVPLKDLSDNERL